MANPPKKVQRLKIKRLNNEPTVFERQERLNNVRSDRYSRTTREEEMAEQESIRKKGSLTKHGRKELERRSNKKITDRTNRILRGDFN